MRVLASILALIPGLALAQLNLTTASNWQSAVQTLAPSTVVNFAAGTYTTTGAWANVTSDFVRLVGAGPGQSYMTSGHATNWGVIRLSGAGARMEGFTIYGGSTSNYGGAVQGTGGQTVSNCVIVSNRARVGGGTYLVDVHNSTLAHNFTYGNLAQGQGGGGILLALTNVARASVVSNNSAMVDGGGVSGPSATISSLVDNCDVVNNSARDGGGLFYVTATNCRIWRNAATNANFQGGGGGKNCVFLGGSVVSNSTTRAGGGAYSAAARGTTFAHNSAGTTGGGGYSLSGTNLVVRDNYAGTTGGGLQYGLAESSTIKRNVANVNGGGGAYLATILYSLVVSNRAEGASGAGGGINGATADSCAFVDNYATTFGEDSFNSTVRNCTLLNTNAATPVVQWNGAPSAVIGNTLVVHASQTNVADNTGAAWTNAAANYFTNSATGLFLPDVPPYRAVATSPLRNVGNDTYAKTPADLWGRDRTQGQVDIGAVEYTPEIDVVSGTVDRKKMRLLLLK